ncbi:MAG: Fic family protein [Candidatus Aenigmatarchaeota archaeon]
MITDNRLLNEISGKMDIVREKSDHFLSCRRREERNLEEMAKYHSLSIEEPELIKKAQYTKNREAKEEEKKLKENLDAAWDYAKREIGSIPDEEDIINLNSMIRFGKEADINSPEAHYRRENVRLSEFNDTPIFEPPEYENIPKEMVKFKDKTEELDQNNLECTVERSNFAHLLLSYIHPFEDGNGRTARMTQNAILHNDEIPPAVVPSHQKHIYIDKIHNAMESYREENEDDLKPFFDYMAGQIIGSLDKVLGYC